MHLHDVAARLPDPAEVLDRCGSLAVLHAVLEPDPARRGCTLDATEAGSQSARLRHPDGRWLSVGFSGAGALLHWHQEPGEGRAGVLDDVPQPLWRILEDASCDCLGDARLMAAALWRETADDNWRATDDSAPGAAPSLLRCLTGRSPERARRFALKHYGRGGGAEAVHHLMALPQPAGTPPAPTIATPADIPSAPASATPTGIPSGPPSGTSSGGLASARTSPGGLVPARAPSGTSAGTSPGGLVPARPASGPLPGTSAGGLVPARAPAGAGSDPVAGRRAARTAGRPPLASVDRPLSPVERSLGAVPPPPPRRRTELFRRRDGSGLVTTAVFRRQAVHDRQHFTDLAAGVDGDMVAIGGGATAVDAPRGALLTASYPADDGSAWLASSKDHNVPQPHRLTAFAIGMRIDGVTRERLAGELLTVVRTRSGHAAHPFASARPPAGHTLIGGGFRVNWRDPGGSHAEGNLATASFPRAGGAWTARSKDHRVSSPCTIDAYAICLKSSFVVGGVRYTVDVRTDFAESGGDPVPHPSATLPLPASGHVLTGIGAEALPTEPGSLLWRLEPTADGTGPGVRSGSKDHVERSPGTLCAWALGIRLIRS
ncbi:hypothetical protein [Streptomyces ortus]|uniref:Uncharacterized protein n=1 Tax=Streptomyces ortus TaxID=2867268 RepID=A0ABT3UV73_9ACTN|nr:hypothetical protein [Streptomyces ortus]MCX4231446.1 hypothetical protein [Streptomyces ortus]